MPRIKLDLTADERIVLPATQTTIFHPYTDAQAGDIVVQSYAYEEAFAEKVRALAERTRPRDLYDVINLFRNADARPSASDLLAVLRKKCEFKGINVPTLIDLEPHKPDLEGSWGPMLSHQLPDLPPVAAFWDELSVFFAWLKGGSAPENPPSYAQAPGEEIIRGRTVRLLLPVEVIRFAASNRLCVDLDYVDQNDNQSTRRIEPYSLRRTSQGNIILHAHNIEKDHHRTYRVDRIQGAQVTDQTFVPRHAIELTPSGPVAFASTATRGSSASLGDMGQSALSSRSRAIRRSGQSSGLTYVYGCSFCGKRFNRKKPTSRLNPHKDKSGYPCGGRNGYLVDTR